MTATKIMRAAGLFLLCTLLACAAHAQNIYGFTSIDYDDVDDLVIADCETVVDYEAGDYYTIEVGCSITDDSSNQVAYGYASDTSDYGEVDIEIEADVTADNHYTARGTHNAIVDYYDWDSGCGNGRTCYTYYDYFNLLYFTNQNVDATSYWDFFMPGPEQDIHSSHLRAGNTHEDVTPPIPTHVYVYFWGPGGPGAFVDYALLKQDYCLDYANKQGWYVVETQSETTLTPVTTGGGPEPAASFIAPAALTMA